jgi:hypothetical protein
MSFHDCCEPQGTGQGAHYPGMLPAEVTACQLVDTTHVCQPGHWIQRVQRHGGKPILPAGASEEQPGLDVHYGAHLYPLAICFRLCVRCLLVPSLPAAAPVPVVTSRSAPTLLLLDLPAVTGVLTPNSPAECFFQKRKDFFN